MVMEILKLHFNNNKIKFKKREETMGTGDFYELSIQACRGLRFGAQHCCLVAGSGCRRYSVSLSFNVLSGTMQCLLHRAVGGALARCHAQRE